MGKWQKELDKVLKISESDAKAFEERTSYYEAVIAAAQGFISGYAKTAPKLGKSISALMDTAEECGRAAAELSVYEDDYEEAKRAKDKGRMKESEQKMSPLVKAFESGKKQNRTAAQEGNKEGHELDKLLGALSGAIG